MVREILQISVGQCGNQIGQIFWKTILEEHDINLQGQFTGSDPRKVEKLDVYMREMDLSKSTKQTLSQSLTSPTIDPSSSNPNGAYSKIVPHHIRYVPRVRISLYSLVAQLPLLSIVLLSMTVMSLFYSIWNRE